MKISYNWLRHYVDIDLVPDELAELLTDTGLEVEGLEKFESIRGGLSGLLIGEVISCEKHPNADKLSVTRVDIGGDTILAVVCGAPNVDTGQKVVVATVGSILYKGDEEFEIKKAKIRGEVSEGMICAEDEIGMGTSHEGIMVLDETAITGTPAAEFFNIEQDYVFEIGLTPNRTDAMGHIGVARDIVAVLRQRGDKNISLKIPSVDDFMVDDNSLDIDIEVENSDDCPRYSGLSMSGLEVAESPAWMQNLLNAIGIRPINNIVDITNFVLMETGQPLHAFDADQIEGSKVIVRKAKKGEKFVTLDEVERKLSTDDLMICDSEKGMCIAGVFGGLKSGVSDKTHDVFLESAHFNAVSVRKTSKFHGLQTDASFRFERGSDPNNTIYALKRAANLIREIANGKVSSEVSDVYPQPIKNLEIDVKYHHVDRLAGKEIPAEMIVGILKDLDILVLKDDGTKMTLSIPAYRVDVTREADVIEEILRIYGYNNIEFSHSVRSSLSFAKKPDPDNLRNLVAELLVSNGFSEVMNNSLTRSSYISESSDLKEENNVPIANPLSNDLDIMRQSLFFGGLETVAYNQNRRITDIKIFEFGRIYQTILEKADAQAPLKKFRETEHLTMFMAGRQKPESWRTSDAKVDLFDLKSMLQNILSRLGIQQQEVLINELSNDSIEAGFTYEINGKILFEGGLVSKKWLKYFDINQDVYFGSLNWDLLIKLVKKIKTSFKPLPKYPEVRRDLALLVDSGVSFREISDTAFKTEKILLKSVGLFDVYMGDKIEKGKKSYAVSYVLQDERQTLTDKVIDKTMNRLIKAYQQQFDAIIR